MSSKPFSGATTFMAVWAGSGNCYNMIECCDQTYQRRIAANFDELDAEKNRELAIRCAAFLNEAAKSAEQPDIETRQYHYRQGWKDAEDHYAEYDGKPTGQPDELSEIKDDFNQLWKAMETAKHKLHSGYGFEFSAVAKSFADAHALFRPLWDKLQNAGLPKRESQPDGISEIERVARAIAQVDESNGAGCWDYYKSSYPDHISHLMHQAKAAIEAMSPMRESVCRTWLPEFGQDHECCDGMVMDVDEYTEGYDPKVQRVPCPICRNSDFNKHLADLLADDGTQEAEFLAYSFKNAKARIAKGNEIEGGQS